MGIHEPSYFEAILELARNMERDNRTEADKITAAIIAVGFSRVIADDPIKAEAALNSLRNLVEINISQTEKTLQ